MIFWDEVKIYLKAGNGGDGLVSFRREKFRPRGGPDGGDGGGGGDIYFEVDPNVNTLGDFNRLKKITADDGGKGQKAKCHGKDGQDLVLKIPLGTVVYELKDKEDPKGKKIIDFNDKKQSALIVKGGKGGWGNYHFATAVYQTPRRANPGQPGQTKWLKLELKLIADVGIIGLPNSGKSTLLSRITNARPKIADYPFTTLVPNLGVSQIGRFSFVACDIPGLIEGASKGKGLGDKFLRHIERTKILVHLVDINADDLVKNYQIIRKELQDFSPILLSKKEIVAVNKIDVIPAEKLASRLENFKKKIKKEIIPLSCVSGENIGKLLYEIKNQLNG
jgi:GTP-binding protein